MNLLFLRTSQAWVFTSGTEIIRLGDNPLFFADIHEAIDAARVQGLLVESNGSVSVCPPKFTETKTLDRYL